jgi:hypothetical protein
MAYGDLRLFRLADGKKAEATIEPARGFDVGAGSGKAVTRTVHGGTVGLILDARGRALEVTSDRAVMRPLVEKWVEALDLYPTS